FGAFMKLIFGVTALTLSMFSVQVFASDKHAHADAHSLEQQNLSLEKNTEGKGYGPQAPRDLAQKSGMNKRVFNRAPDYKHMNLCNIHVHENAEHKGGDFTTFAGYGDGKGYGTGYKYAGKLTAAESVKMPEEVCKSDHGSLQVGDTIEIHYVHSSALVKPGPTLNACLSEADSNPQLRVEAQVFVLVNDAKAADFNKLTAVGEISGYQQALNIPANSGKPIQYAGSTTGPSYNEKGSPLQVTWSVRPKVIKVNAASVGEWCKGNPFNEDHAHGVRNLVTNPKLLSNM
ncbi:MAG: delta-class carbonic anhydrase, partial [Limnohabitans sp.]